MGSTKLANPNAGPDGNSGMSTFLLNLHNAGFRLDGIILAMGILRYRANFCRSAGYKRQYCFGLTAFTSRSFWLTLVAILLMPKMGLTVADAP
ncbi:acetate uptake transporter [Salmonella enterica subsp. enterica]|nr:acetate uptake transporter [Salmonella enterica subsp. enterica]